MLLMLNVLLSLSTSICFLAVLRKSIAITSDMTVPAIHINRYGRLLSTYNVMSETTYVTNNPITPQKSEEFVMYVNEQAIKM